MKTTLLRIGAIAVALQILSASAQTQVLYVVPSGTAGNSPASPYATWETAANSIADALSAVTDEAVINVKPGVYNIGQQINVDKPNVTIQSCDESGSLARETTILDGGYPERYEGEEAKATSNRLFYICSENVTLRGLTLRNSIYAGNGGGIYVESTFKKPGSGKTYNVVNFIIDTCVISNCHAIAGDNGKGGGVAYASYANRGHVITKSTIRNCVASKYGGGINGNGNAQVTRTSHLLITGSEFIGNKTQRPGGGGSLFGIHLGAGSTWSENCLFKGGSSNGSLSSAFNTACDSVFTNCVMESLAAGGTPGANGGKNSFYDCLFHSTNLGSSDVYIFEGCVFSNMLSAAASYVFFGADCKVRNCLWTCSNHPMTANGQIENCTIAGNNTVGFLCATAGSQPQLINCIVYGNKYHNDYKGPNIGYRSPWSAGVSASLTLKNCYIENGDESSIPNPQNSKAATLLQDFDSTGATAAIIAKAKAKGPGFVDEANGDWRLTRKSPLRDAGLNADWMVNATDLEGKPRLLQLNGKYSATATVDLGCYECDLPIEQKLCIMVR